MADSTTTTDAPFSGADEPSKAQLQRQMEQARASITQTVEEIKETVSEQVENVKETVSDVLDWNEHFKNNPLVWGAAAVGAGLVIGYSIAVMRQGEQHNRRRRANESVGEGLLGELATVGENIILPAINERIKGLFGIDLSEHLFKREAVKPKRAAGKKISKKSVTTKRATKKIATKRAAKQKSS